MLLYLLLWCFIQQLRLLIQVKNPIKQELFPENRVAATIHVTNTKYKIKKDSRNVNIYCENLIY